MELEVKVLAGDEARMLGGMTFPAYRHLLDLAPQPRHADGADTRTIQPLALLALSGRQPLGLLLAELPLSGRAPAELLSLFVQPAQRNQGVATALLGALEAELARIGAERLAVVYMSGKPSIPALERVLHKRGFDAPAPRMVSIRFDAERMNQAEWLHKYRPRSGYQVFSWMDLGEAEREVLKAGHASKPWIAADLLPWEHDRHGFEPATSVGLRYHGEVVGWVINHRLDADTVRYTCSFVREDLARLGRILPLYRESFSRMRRFGFRNGLFATPLHHPSMARFALKWFGPYASFVGETRGSEKVLDHAA